MQLEVTLKIFTPGYASIDNGFSMGENVYLQLYMQYSIRNIIQHDSSKIVTRAS